MSCECQSSKDAGGGGGDRLSCGSTGRLFDGSATAWLVGQGVRYLNAADKESELAYTRVVEVLRTREDLLEIVVGLVRTAQAGDATLRWSLLHVLGDAGSARCATFLVSTSLEKLPERHPDDGCESLRDVELLIRTMAVHGLQRIALRERDAAEGLLKIVSAKPDRAVLIEAVKCATDLGLAEKARRLVADDHHWIFDIRRARTEELFADAERKDGGERGFTPPKPDAQNRAPRLVSRAVQEC